MHLFMVGDWVFDNGAYVRVGEPDVREQVGRILGQDARVSSAAQDGAVIAGVRSQVANRPPDTTHLVVSAGGNDALDSTGVLDVKVRSIMEALEKIADIAEAFTLDYVGLMDQLVSTRLPVAVCTIYDPRFPDGRLRRTGATALSVLNGVITREAFARSFALIDLRLVCSEDTDFANPIEPSAQGGAKIAQAIARFASGSVSSTVFA